MPAGSRYVEVSREKMEAMLKGAGFEVHAQAKGHEVVYRRRHHADPTMWVKVYTSLSKDASAARGCGEDAIRVVLVFENPRTGASGCLYKCPRVYRTGSEQKVLDRLLERMREAYGAGGKRVAARKAGQVVTGANAPEPAEECECGHRWTPNHECYVTRGEAALAARME